MTYVEDGNAKSIFNYTGTFNCILNDLWTHWAPVVMVVHVDIDASIYDEVKDSNLHNIVNSGP